MKKNLTVSQGETLLLNLALQNPDQTPVNLTGHSMTLRVWNLETEIANAVVNGDATGSVALRVQDEATALWPLGPMAYRVEHNQPNGDKFFVLSGDLTVEGKS